MIKAAICLCLIFGSNRSVEVTSGFGGIVWENVQDHPIKSDIMTNITVKRIFSDGWFYGAGLTFNSYSGDGYYFYGAGAIIMDFMVYRKINMEDLKIVMGFGGAATMLYSRRLIPSGESIPEGVYSYWNAGLSGALSLGIFKPVTSALEFGIKMNFYAGGYLDRCWENGDKDCRKRDQTLQQWFVGVVLRFSY